MKARIDGTHEWCGGVPLVRIDAPKPRLTNNGYNCFSGTPRNLHVPGLASALPDDCRIIRQGYVMLVFSDGGTFGTYASDTNGDDTYDFS